MRTGGFHTLRGDAPYLRLQIYFAPPRAYDLTGPGRRENLELKRPRRHARANPQRGQERRHIVKWQCGVVRHPPQLGAARKNMREAPPPLRRVRTLAIAMHDRGIKHRLDPAAYPACCFRLLAPDRIEHLHDEPGIDRRDWQIGLYPIEL